MTSTPDAAATICIRQIRPRAAVLCTSGAKTRGLWSAASVSSNFAKPSERTVAEDSDRHGDGRLERWTARTAARNFDERVATLLLVVAVTSAPSRHPPRLSQRAQHPAVGNCRQRHGSLACGRFLCRSSSLAVLRPCASSLKHRESIAAASSTIHRAPAARHAARVVDRSACRDRYFAHASSFAQLTLAAGSRIDRRMCSALDI